MNTFIQVCKLARATGYDKAKTLRFITHSLEFYDQLHRTGKVIVPLSSILNA